MLSAEEARELHLISKVVPGSELMAEVRKLCAKLVSKGAIALRMAKEAIELGSEADLAAGMEIEAKSWSVCFTTEDRAEGVKAFLEKRKPNFKGR
jgi:enoyl-CoA hydratase